MYQYAGKSDKSDRQEEVLQRAALMNHTGIPDNIKQKFEQGSGYSLDDVKVHYNSSKPVQMQALAYTQGSQVYIGPGQEQHLGHELSHVIQQKQGIVTPTGSIGGELLNDDDSLEQAADQTAAKYLA